MTVEHELVQRQVLRGRSAGLTVQFYADGAPHDPGVVTVGIVNDAGDTIVASGTATAGSGSNPRTYDLAAQETLGLLTVTWALPNGDAFSSRVEVVGAFLFTVAEARRFDKLQAENVPIERIEAMRARITDDFATIAGVQFVPRLRQIVTDGSGTAEIWLPDLRPQYVSAVEVRHPAGGWEPWSVPDVLMLEVEVNGQVISPNGKVFPKGRRSLRVSYVHGHVQPPHEIRNAALTLLINDINPSNLPAQALSFSDDTGTYRMAAAGERGREYGLPSVDAALVRYSERVPGIG